jgi:uncharacterized membrane protein
MQAIRQALAQIGWRRMAIAVPALVGIYVASYLLWTHYSGTPIVCILGAAQTCGDVSASQWGEFVFFKNQIPGGLHIPISWPGLALYLTLLVLALAAPVVAGGRWRGLSGQVIFALAFGGVVYSAYLTYIELFVLHEVCPWCVISATCVTLIWLLAWPSGQFATQTAEEEGEEDDG